MDKFWQIEVVFLDKKSKVVVLKDKPFKYRPEVFAKRISEINTDIDYNFILSKLNKIELDENHISEFFYVSKGHRILVKRDEFFQLN